MASKYRIGESPYGNDWEIQKLGTDGIWRGHAYVGSEEGAKKFVDMTLAHEAKAVIRIEWKEYP